VLQTQAMPGGWRTEPRAADFFSARALLEAVLEVAGIEWRAEPDDLAFLHPGRSASVLADTRNIGWIGELHPLVASEWDLAGPVAGFEIDMDAVAELAEGAERVYSDVTSFPAVLQDIAVVVPDETPAAAVVAAVREGGGDLLAGVEIFDLYRGEQVGEGEKSLALRLEFRSPERTLTDAEVASPRDAIEGALAALGGRLRA
jgi:phenylalanyl-tRNA synthetase beta chain